MDESLHNIFIQEAEENLHILENLIISIEENPGDKNIINDAFRAIHSIKGGAGLAGFPEIKDFTHTVEDLFEYMRSGVLQIRENLISIILQALDILKMMIANIKNNQNAGNGIDTGETIGKIKDLLSKAESNSHEATLASTNPPLNSNVKDNKKNLFYLDLKFYPEIFKSGINPLMFIGDLEQAGTVLFIHTVTDELPEISNFEPENFYLSWQLFYETAKSEKDLYDIFCFVMDDSKITITNLNAISDDPEALNGYSINGRSLLDFKSEEKNVPPVEPEKPAPAEISDSSASSYIRVQTEKLENIFNTVSELLISQARLNMLTEEHEENIPDSFGAVTDSLKNITKRLQEQVTYLRMMSLKTTFNRFKRVVRDIAADRQKKVKLLIYGQDTELDKNMIEKLNDPLKHLVRNSIDHGIETETERIAKGKSPEGILKLAAYLERGKVVIEVTDDGRGIDKEKLLHKAKERGIISTDSHLSEGEIQNLIFHPGFSTAEAITDLSGRGVGMDVVKSSINELNGNIEISSEKEKGTSFKLHLPLTLAIMDGMLVKIGKEKYIIPTLAILEIFRPKAENIKTVSARGEVVFFRGEYIPMVRLHDIFTINEMVREPTKAQLIVVNSAGIKAALLVDTVLEQYQIVLKSLQRNFRKVDFISSATILGNGDVALIIDIQSLIEKRLMSANV